MTGIHPSDWVRLKPDPGEQFMGTDGDDKPQRKPDRIGSNGITP